MKLKKSERGLRIYHDMNDVFVIAHIEYGIVEFIRENEENNFSGRFTSNLESAKIFYLRKDAKQYLRVTTTFFDRLFHWRIRKVGGVLFE